MAIPFPTTYFIGIGTAISNLGVITELSGGSYARLACNFTGSALSGLTQTVGPWVVATAPTPAVNSLYGMIFDVVTLGQGNLIAYWTWSAPYTGSLTAFPSTVINLGFNTYIQQALNLSLLGGAGSSGSSIDAGAQIGIAQGGNPMIAGIKLTMQSGALVAARNVIQEVGPLGMTFTSGGVNIAHLDASGNLVVKGTLTAFSATVGTSPIP
jgi:hypothetical protein